MTSGTVSGGVVTRSTATAAHVSGSVLGLVQTKSTSRFDPVDYNVVYILIDDAGKECYSVHASLNSGLVAKTPRLCDPTTGFVTKGVLLGNHYVCPICGPTRAAGQLGLYGRAAGNGLSQNIEEVDVGFRLSDSSVFIPEMLSLGRPTNIYACACRGKWHMCSYQGQDGHPFDNGYDFAGQIANVVSDIAATPADFNGAGHYRLRRITSPTSYSYTPPAFGSTYEISSPPPYPGTPDGLTYDWSTWSGTTAFRDAVTWINAQGNKPFFFYLTPNPPHAPFQRSPNTMPDDIGVGNTGGTLKLISDATKATLDGIGLAVGDAAVGSNNSDVYNTFNGNLEAIDTLIGWLFDRMTPAVRDRTIFIVTSDNGTVSNAIQPPYDPLHAKRTLNEQGLWSFGLVFTSGSFITSPGRTFNGLTHVVDVPRTIADICKVDWDLVTAGNTGPLPFRDSQSFLRALHDPSWSGSRTEIYSELFSPLGGPPNPTTWNKAIRDANGWKLIKPPTGNPKFFRTTSAAGFASGQPGYLELTADDYFPTITTTAPAAAKVAYAALTARMAVIAAQP